VPDNRKRLNDRQLAVLAWISAGCPNGVMTDNTYKTTAVALQGRRLVTISRRGGRWPRLKQPSRPPAGPANSRHPAGSRRATVAPWEHGTRRDVALMGPSTQRADRSSGCAWPGQSFRGVFRSPSRWRSRRRRWPHAVPPPGPADAKGGAADACGTRGASRQTLRRRAHPRAGQTRRAPRESACGHHGPAGAVRWRAPVGCRTTRRSIRRVRARLPESPTAGGDATGGAGRGHLVHAGTGNPPSVRALRRDVPARRLRAENHSHVVFDLAFAQVGWRSSVEAWTRGARRWRPPTATGGSTWAASARFAGIGSSGWKCAGTCLRLRRWFAPPTRTVSTWPTSMRYLQRREQPVRRTHSGN
jgi:hypothetical protein